MGNRIAGDVDFEADGKRWVLRFDFNALCALEEGLGVDLASLGAPGQAVRAATLRTMVRVGLAHHHGELSDLAAGDIVQAVGLAAMTELVAQAFTAAFAVPAGKSDRPPVKAARA